MSIVLRVVGDVSVLEFAGKITRGTGDVEMRERFREALATEGTNFVFDLRSVPFVDSAAIGEMVACLKRARNQGGTIKLVLVPGARPHALLKLAALDKVFEIHDDEQRAIGSFSE